MASLVHFNFFDGMLETVFAGDSASLAALEGLMKELFSPETNNERKRSLERLLHDFSSQQGAWQQCVFFLSNTTNPYVTMYCITTIEMLINKQWLGLQWEDRAQLKSVLYQMAVNQQAHPNYVRNKLVKLVVDIARLDWPHFYPDFFTNIMQLLQQRENIVLGLVFVRTASEELISPREDLSSARRDELRRLLTAHVPQLLFTLNNVLEQTLEEENVRRNSGCSKNTSNSDRAVTATPPPSPTHGQPDTSSPSGSLLSSMLASGARSNNHSSSSSNDTEVVALEALGHLLSWIPLGPHIPTALLVNLVRVAQQSALLDDPTLTLLSLGCVNEILYKNGVPVDWEDNLLGVIQLCLNFLTALMPSVDILDSSIIEKLLEILRLALGQHLHRLERNPKFPLVDLVSVLLQLTFQLCDVEKYYQCLEIWGCLLEYIQHQRSGQLVARFQEVLVVLVSQVLRKIQFRHNADSLCTLDDNVLDDDSETEWQRFLRENIECIAKVADLAPVHIYALVLEPWKDACAEYTRLCSERSATPQTLSSLHDLATLTRAIGRFCPHFTGDSFLAGFQQAQQLMQGLVALAGHATRLRPHRWSLSMEALPRVLLQIHAQVLAALKAWCHWLAQLQVNAQDSVGLRPLAERLVGDSVRGSIPLLMEGSSPGSTAEPAPLVHSAAHLLLTVARTVRPPAMWNMESLRGLYGESWRHLPPETQSIIQQALCNSVLAISSPADSWDERHKLLTILVDTITEDLRRALTGGACAPGVAPAAARSFKQLSAIVENAEMESAQARRLLHTCLQPWLEQALALFPLHMNEPEMSEQILNLFLVTLGCPQTQLGAPFTQRALHVFLDSFASEPNLEVVLREHTSTVERLLQLLQLVVTQPGNAHRQHIGSALSLCMNVIYPVVADMTEPTVKSAVFQLLYNILLHKWQYFYSGPNQGGAQSAVRAEVRAPFIAVLNAFGESLLKPDINIFRQNLHGLESLNSKWRLYHKPEFCEGLLGRFLSVLLNSLVNQSHALLSEDITLAIYNMASVDFSAFQTSFLPEFLRACSELNDSQRSILVRNFTNETDLPSFTQNISRLTNDVRCFKLCNSCLPAGSVVL